MTWFLDKQFLESIDLRGYDAAGIAARVGVPLATARAFVDPLRRYTVRSHPEYGWLAGADGSQRPMLLFVGSPRVASTKVYPLNAVAFDLDTGAVEARAIACKGDLDWESVFDVADAELGFVHVGSAPVLAFKHPEVWHYAVVPFPFHLHADALTAGEHAVPAVRQWIERGNFVLHCGNAYYMTAEGDVESS